MAVFPINSSSRRTDARACAIVHYQFDAEHWQYREGTGADFGCDCELELSENDCWCGNKIECQIKGTRNIQDKILKTEHVISFALETKTINYGLGKANAFILLVVDVEGEAIYYQCLQEYFLEHEVLLDKLSENQKTLNIRIPMRNILTADDGEMQRYAKARYLRDSTGVPRLVNQ